MNFLIASFVDCCFDSGSFVAIFAHGSFVVIFAHGFVSACNFYDFSSTSALGFCFESFDSGFFGLDDSFDDFDSFDGFDSFDDFDSCFSDRGFSLASVAETDSSFVYLSSISFFEGYLHYSLASLAVSQFSFQFHFQNVNFGLPLRIYPLLHF